jgi:hypothetical protein
MGVQIATLGQKAQSTRQVKHKKTKVKQKRLCVAQHQGLSCASGSDPLDLLTKTVNIIQRAWINKDPTRQISPHHPTAGK